jgi:hypothetical protein
MAIEKSQAVCMPTIVYRLVWSIIASVNWSGQQCGRSSLPSVQPQHFDSSESAGDFQAEEKGTP